MKGKKQYILLAIALLLIILSIAAYNYMYKLPFHEGFAFVWFYVPPALGDPTGLSPITNRHTNKFLCCIADPKICMCFICTYEGEAAAGHCKRQPEAARA